MMEYPDAPPSPEAAPSPAAPQPAPAPLAPPAPNRAVAQRGGGSSRATTILLGVAAVIAIGGVAFAVGRMTAPAAAASTSRFGTGGFRTGLTAEGSFAPGAGRGAFGALGGAGADIGVSGTVQSISGNAMTVTTAAGETVTVDLSPSTTYHTATSASQSSVTSGSHVIVQVQFNRAAAGTGGGADTGVGAAPLASGAPRTLNASDVTVVTP
jgi:hypothetical protein